MACSSIVTINIAEAPNKRAGGLFPEGCGGVSVIIRLSSTFVELTLLLQDEHGLMRSGDIEFHPLPANHTGDSLPPPITDHTQSLGACGITSGSTILCSLLSARCPHGQSCLRFGCPRAHPPSRPPDCPHGLSCALPPLRCGLVHPGDWTRALALRPCRFGRGCSRRATCAYNHDGGGSESDVQLALPVPSCSGAPAPGSSTDQMGHHKKTKGRKAPVSATNATEQGASAGGLSGAELTLMLQAIGGAPPKRRANAQMEAQDASAKAFTPISGLSSMPQCPWSN